MLADHLRRTLDKDRRVGKAVAQHVRPDRGQLATARHVGSPVVGAFDLSRRNVRKHQVDDLADVPTGKRSEEHTSELQSLMRISYAVFCLKKKKKRRHNIDTTTHQQHKRNDIHNKVKNYNAHT